MLLSVLSLSISQLKRILRLLHLKRRLACGREVLKQMLLAIQRELDGSDQCLGIKPCGTD